MESISVIFCTARGIQSIAVYMGVIESAQADVAKLRHRDFNSAIENLKYAQSCQTIKEASRYIETARVRFIDAISLEENENKVDVFVGLAMCQYFQGDFNLAKKTLERISTEVKLTSNEKYKTIAKDVIAATSPSPVIIDPAPPMPSLITIGYHLINALRNPERYPLYSKRVNELENKKNQAREAIKIL